MYSSVSLALVGNNSLIYDLRVLTSIELFLNSDFYYKHPCFTSVYENKKSLFMSSYDSLIAFSVSHEAFDSNLCKEFLIECEALLNLINSDTMVLFVFWLWLLFQGEKLKLTILILVPKLTFPYFHILFLHAKTWKLFLWYIFCSVMKVQIFLGLDSNITTTFH